MRRRLHVIPFNRQFSEHEADKNLFNEIWEEEASGILNIMLSSHLQLEQRGNFNFPQESIEATQEWLKRGNNLMMFLSDNCEKCDGRGIKLSDLYNNYLLFCSSERIPNNLNKGNFKSRLQSLGHTIETGGGNETYVYGMTLKDNEPFLSNSLLSETIMFQIMNLSLIHI